MQDFSVLYITARGLDTGSFVPFFYLVKNLNAFSALF